MAKLDNTYNTNQRILGTNPLRARGAVRAFMHREIVNSSRIIAALLIVETQREGSPIPVVPIGDIERVAQLAASLGISAVKVFVESHVKSDDGSEAINDDGLMVRAIKAIKQAAPQLCVITDTCLCSYTTDGDCVLLNSDASIDRERTLSLLAKQTDLQLSAGADVVGPAPMFDGAVSYLRSHLDGTGQDNVPLMPHLTWRSPLYRTYRSVMNTGTGNQREGFQIDPACPDQFLSMASAMAKEGASIIQLQPGLYSLDIVHSLKSTLSVPIALYSVSGEYRMLRSLGSDDKSFFDALYEHATVSLRTGADYLLTYAWSEILTGIPRFIKGDFDERI